MPARTAIYVQVGPGLEENGKFSRQAAALPLRGKLKLLLQGFVSLNLKAVSESVKLSPGLLCSLSTVKSNQNSRLVCFGFKLIGIYW